MLMQKIEFNEEVELLFSNLGKRVATVSNTKCAVYRNVTEVHILFTPGEIAIESDIQFTGGTRNIEAHQLQYVLILNEEVEEASEFNMV